MVVWVRQLIGRVADTNTTAVNILGDLQGFQSFTGECGALQQEMSAYMNEQVGGDPTTKKIMPPGKSQDVLCLFCCWTPPPPGREDVGSRGLIDLLVKLLKVVLRSCFV